MEYDILIVKPADQKNVYGGLDDYQLTAYEPPLWTALLAGFMRGKGFKTAVLDAEVENLSTEKIAEYICKIAPLLTLISVSGTNPSASTQNMIALRKIVHACRIKEKKHMYIAAHGIHVSALPERTLLEEDIDFVCLGEGFYTLPELVCSLKAKVGQEALKKIPGLFFRIDEKNVHGNRNVQTWSNLDELPMAAWDLLPMDKYRAHNWQCFGSIEKRQPYGIIWTALGCPFHCNFCCINTMFGRKSGIRYRSPELVVKEIDYLVEKYNIKNFKIVDELFCMNERRVLQICDLLIERSYDLNIWAYARVDTVTKKMLKAMRRAGIKWIAYGFESGSKETLENVSKGYSLDKVNDVVKMTYDEGIHIGANYMFGFLDDNYESMQKTLELAFSINSEWANFNSVMAYPGSRLYDEALNSGCRLPDSWQGYSQYSIDCLPMDTKYISAEEVISFRDYAFYAYFTNPRYLAKIEHLFGVDTVRHIKKMTEVKLKRKNKYY